nr:hypothetical protein [Nitrosomonas nitrosa]
MAKIKVSQSGASKVRKAGSRKAVGAKTEKRQGIKDQIKAIILRHPGISANDIAVALQRKGVSASRFTVTGIRAEFRHSLKFLKSKGYLKDIAI